MTKRKTTKTSRRAKSVLKKKTLRSKKTTTIKKTKKKEKPVVSLHVEEKKPKNLSLRYDKMQEIKKTLIGQKEALLSEAEEALNALPGQTVFPDMGDQATAEIDRNFMLRLRSREQKLLKKIDEAIERIDNGTFGICDACGIEIDIRRLQARPVTTLCIDCKTQQEEEERTRGE